MVRIKGFSDIKVEKVKEAAKKVAVSADSEVLLLQLLSQGRVQILVDSSSLRLSMVTFERSVSEFPPVASSWMLV